METSYFCRAGLKGPLQFAPVKEKVSVSRLHQGRNLFGLDFIHCVKRSIFSETGGKGEKILYRCR